MFCPNISLQKRPCPRLNSISFLALSSDQRLQKSAKWSRSQRFEKSSCIPGNGKSFMSATIRLLNPCGVVVLRIFVLLIFRLGVEHWSTFLSKTNKQFWILSVFSIDSDTVNAVLPHWKLTVHHPNLLCLSIVAERALISSYLRSFGLYCVLPSVHFMRFLSIFISCHTFLLLSHLVSLHVDLLLVWV